MSRQSDSIKFLEAYDPSLRKKGTDFNIFFPSLKLGEIFYVDRTYIVDSIMEIAEKQYGLVISLVSDMSGNPGYEFEVTNYSDRTLEDFRYNVFVTELNKMSIEDRLRIKERLSEVFCLDCMENKKA